MENCSIKSTWTNIGSANTRLPTALFCESCQAYLGATALVCPVCQASRQSPLPVRPGQPLWRGELGGPACGRPVIAGELALFTSSDRRQGSLTALDRRTGERRWQFQASHGLESGLAVAEGRVFFASRGFMKTEAQLYCLDLETGERLWEQEICGGAWSPPAFAGQRLYLACEDGWLRCLDARSGQPLSNWSLRIPSGRAWLARDAERLVIVCANGQVYLVALDRPCSKPPKAWELGGKVTSPPALGAGWLYAALEDGQLVALNLSDGQRRGLAQGLGSLVAAPALDGGMVFVGGQDHCLRALDLSTGLERWLARFQHAIISTPLATGGLVYCAANDGALHAFEAASGQPAGDFQLGAETSQRGCPEFADGVVYIGGHNCQAYALPWHLGQYAWAAGWLEKAGRMAQAAECRALEGHFSAEIEARTRAYQSAAEDWRLAGQEEKSAQLWLALEQRALAAEAFQAAGGRWRMQDSPRAAGYFEKAANLHFVLHHHQAVNDCTRALASCACLPYISLRPINMGNFIQWQEGQLTLRLVNEGLAAVEGLVLWIGGALKNVIEVPIPANLAPGHLSRLPLTITPTKSLSVLEIEIEYPSASPQYPLLRGMFALDIQAIEAPKPPLVIGDVGLLRLTIGEATAEGLQIIARDVGVMRSESGIGEIKAAGDVGAVSAHNGINTVNIAGDVGLARGINRHE